jgi:hypothetical protein
MFAISVIGRTVLSRLPFSKEAPEVQAAWLEVVQKLDKELSTTPSPEDIKHRKFE